MPDPASRRTALTRPRLAGPKERLYYRQHCLVDDVLAATAGRRISSRIENLRVEGGQPAPDRRLIIIRAAKLDSKDSGLKVPVSDDPELKQTFCDLLDEIEQLQEGDIVRFEFRHGMPLR
jgi:hypothetical protein